MQPPSSCRSTPKSDARPPARPHRPPARPPHKRKATPGRGTACARAQVEFRLTTTQVSGLASAYSWPNIVVPVLGGAIADWLGVRGAGLLFATFVATGATIFALAVQLDLAPSGACA